MAFYQAVSIELHFLLNHGLLSNCLYWITLLIKPWLVIKLSLLNYTSYQTMACYQAVSIELHFLSNHGLLSSCLYWITLLIKPWLVIKLSLFWFGTFNASNFKRCIMKYIIKYINNLKGVLDGGYSRNASCALH
jgi:hypothetical protein